MVDNVTENNIPNTGLAAGGFLRENFGSAAENAAVEEVIAAARQVFSQSAENRSFGKGRMSLTGYLPDAPKREMMQQLRNIFGDEAPAVTLQALQAEQRQRYVAPVTAPTAPRPETLTR